MCSKHVRHSPCQSSYLFCTLTYCKLLIERFVFIFYCFLSSETEIPSAENLIEVMINSTAATSVHSTCGTGIQYSIDAVISKLIT